MNKSIDTIIFDLGGVVIDWNLRYVYRKIFKTEEETEWFLENVTTAEWNENQDAGYPLHKATEELVAKPYVGASTSRLAFVHSYLCFNKPQFIT